MLLNSSLEGNPYANARPGGPGDAFLFFDTLFRTAPLNNSLEILNDWIALPNSGVVDARGAVTGISLLHRDGVTTCTSSMGRSRAIVSLFVRMDACSMDGWMDVCVCVCFVCISPSVSCDADSSACADVGVDRYRQLLIRY